MLVRGLIIDVGIGTGIGLSSLKGFSPVVGIDGAIEMLRVALGQIKDSGQRTQLVSLVCAFAEALPFRDCSAPTVISITVIQNLTDVHQGVNELIRITQIDGIIAVTSLSKSLPLHELAAKFDVKFKMMAQFENLADEDDGLILQLCGKNQIKP
jgi:ubiquinone/menaquinone biosynthesis C-methylase UbiE